MTMHFSQDSMQANLGFVQKQTSHIESQVYKIKYPDIQYPRLIPVDTSANSWVTSVTYYSMDQAGQAEWVSGKAQDIPLANVEQAKHETPVYMAGIGYDYGLEEINQAQMLGMNLQSEKAQAARRAYEEMVDRIALEGDATKGFNGLFDHPEVTSTSATADGASSSALWADKDGDQILRDVNDLLTGVYSDTKTTEVADTLILPFERFNAIATKRLGDTDNTVLEFLRQNNVYTALTSQALSIIAARKLDDAGAGSTSRMIAYRRSPEVLKLHIPMPHQFLPVQIKGLSYEIPGVFRLGGLDVRLPKAIRYVDGI